MNSFIYLFTVNFLGIFFVAFPATGWSQTTSFWTNINVWTLCNDNFSQVIAELTITICLVAYVLFCFIIIICYCYWLLLSSYLEIIDLNHVSQFSLPCLVAFQSLPYSLQLYTSKSFFRKSTTSATFQTLFSFSNFINNFQAVKQVSLFICMIFICFVIFVFFIFYFFFGSYFINDTSSKHFLVSSAESLSEPNWCDAYFMILFFLVVS